MSTVIRGRCVEVGDDWHGQPCLVIHTTKEAIQAFEGNMVFAGVEVRLAPDEVDGVDEVDGPSSDGDVPLFSVEPHGPAGWAIYRGRTATMHGMNLGHLTECEPGVPEMIADALNERLKRMHDAIVRKGEVRRG